MKYSLIALVAASTALAHGHNGKRHAAHADMFAKYDAPSAPAGGDCPQAEKVCTTYTTSRVHAVTKYYTAPSSTVTVVPVYESKPAPVCPGSPECPDHPSYPVPTPVETICPTPGVYTIPAKTITFEHTYSAAVPVVTPVTPGSNTYGGITTIIKKATTVVCPYATVETCSDGTVTSKITSTTYVCPTPGTYTIAPTTTVVDKATEVTCVVPTTYTPGTYVHPEQTVTVTKTSQVVYCPYETSKPEAPVAPKYTAPAPKPTYVAPTPEAPVYKPVPVAPKPEAPVYKPVPVAPKPAPEAPVYKPVPVAPKPEAPVYKPVPVAPKPSPKAPTYGSTPQKPSTGSGLWSISYSPFNDDHSCKDKDAVAADIADISSKGFKNVRVYSTECDTLENVGSACSAHKMKLIVGIFFKGGIESGNDQVEALLAYNQWSTISLVVIGNESVFNGVCSAAELGAYMKATGDKFRAQGYTGSITTAETLGVYEKPEVAAALCPYMDVIGVNIQPYFDGGRTAEQAGDFMKSQLELTEKICPGGKTGYVLEAGWPSGGSCNGAACPGKSAQATAIEGMKTAVPGRVSYFTYRDDGWKAPGAHNIENKFGCGDLF